MSEHRTADPRPRFHVSDDGRHIYDDDFHWDAKLVVSGDFIDRDRIRYAQAIVDALNKAEIPRE